MLGVIPQNSIIVNTWNMDDLNILVLVSVRFTFYPYEYPSLNPQSYCIFYLGCFITSILSSPCFFCFFIHIVLWLVVIGSFKIFFQRDSELLSSHREALPLSIFGDEGLETTDDFSMDEDASTFISVHDNKNPGSNVSINDLISSLYSQTEKVGSINPSPEENENGINSSSRLSHSDLENDDDDDDSWEFKDASPDVLVPDQTFLNILEDLPKQSSTILQLDCYMELYHKLNLALNHAVHCLLENLKVGHLMNMTFHDVFF